MKGPRPRQKRRWRHDATDTVAARFGQDRLAPARHFECGASREGQQQQTLRIAAVQDQMGHPVGERLGLAGAGTGGDQQCRRWFCITVDAVFDSAALFGVKVVQMPAAIDRLQLHVPFLFSATAIASARQLRNALGPVEGKAPRAFVQNNAPADFRAAGQANRVAGLTIRLQHSSGRTARTCDRRRFWSSQALVDDLPQRSGIGPGQLHERDNELRSNPINPGRRQRRPEAGGAWRRDIERHLSGCSACD